jgi:hypothetical protein
MRDEFYYQVQLLNQIFLSIYDLTHYVKMKLWIYLKRFKGKCTCNQLSFSHAVVELDASRSSLNHVFHKLFHIFLVILDTLIVHLVIAVRALFDDLLHLHELFLLCHHVQ